MRIITMASLGICMAGCTASQHTLSDTNHISKVPVTVSEIQNAISCEFVYAFEEIDGTGLKVLGDWGAFVEMKLTAKDASSIAPGLGPITLKSGNAELTAATAGLTIDDWVQDQNVIAYSLSFKKARMRKDCPEQGSSKASSGLGLSEFIVGTSDVVNAGGILGASEGDYPFIALDDGTQQLRVGAASGSSADRIPTIIYERTFSIIRKVGGGLTFKLDHFAFSIGADKTGAGRTRDGALNKITVTMGRMGADRNEPSSEDRALENNVLRQRELPGPVIILQNQNVGP